MFNAFGNATQVPPRNWRDEPATRGTWNILSTCLITLGLCLWTALHLNIPRHKEGVWRPVMRKTLWLLLGLFAPEMLAYTAWYQHQAAHKLSASMQRKLGQRIGITRTQRFAAFFTRCCRRKQDGGLQTGDVELDNRETTDVEYDASGSRASVRRHRWTTTHSFYFLMGGFVFDTSNEDVNFLPNSRQRLTLTPAGLIYILENEPDLIPNISEEHIYDKSKASSLVKTVVCLQALWFCVQCIVRLSQGIAVSLLELNVFGHAICALLMYILWWDKPLDIQEPTVLSGNMAREMCALLCMRSGTADSADYPELPFGIKYGSDRMRNFAEISARPDEDYPKIKYMLDKIIAGMRFRFKYLGIVESRGGEGFLECCLLWTEDCSVDQQSGRLSQYIAYPVDLSYPRNAAGPKDLAASPSLPMAPADATDNSLHAPNVDMTNTQRLPPGSSVATNSIGIDGFFLTVGTWMDNPLRFHSRKPQPDYAPVSVTLFDADVVRWQLCARALRLYCPQVAQWGFSSDIPGDSVNLPSRSVYDRSPNWPSSQDRLFTKESSDSISTIWLGFSPAGLVYGGLHLFAWDAPFPSPLENKIWRRSGVLLASSGFICALWAQVYKLSFVYIRFYRSSFWQDLVKTRLRHWYSAIESIIFFGSWLVFLLPLISFAVAYLAARGYIVVESFLQLGHLPDSAYALPEWSQYFPHIM